MKLKKYWIVGTCILTLLTSGCSQNGAIGRNDIEGDRLTIGLIQYEESERAVEAKQGFLDYLNEKGINHQSVDIMNKVVKLNGSSEAIIIEQMMNERVDLIYAIMPNSEASLFTSAHEGDLPIIYSSAIKPNESMSEVNGVVHVLDLNKQFQLITKLLNDAHTMGIFVKEGKFDHQDEIEKLAFENGLKIRLLAEDFKEASLEADERPDFIFISDESVSLDKIFNYARELKIPVFAMNEEYFEKGLLAIEVVSDYECGRMAGKMAYEAISEGKSLSDMQVEIPSVSHLYLNQSIAEQLEIELPNELKQRIKQYE